MLSPLSAILFNQAMPRMLGGSPSKVRSMLFANYSCVHNAAVFVGALIGAVAARKDWALDYIKYDYGLQSVYVKYVGQRSRGEGLKASAFYRLSDPTTLHVTIHADERPTHLHGDESATRRVKPLLEAAHEASRLGLNHVAPEEHRPGTP